MEIEILMEFLTESALILVPVLWIIGTFIKHVPSIPDWLIVWILLILGILFAVFTLGFSAQSVIQGIIATGVAVYGHQLLKQTFDKRVSSK